MNIILATTYSILSEVDGVKRYRVANLKLADTGLSNQSKILKKTNERLIKELKKMRHGPIRKEK
ncbi:hypothetical protein JOD43_004116 [Pullulanibacillus pueri]|nr:hypothetical protein [Pullulanibacillus pueri]